MRRLILAAIAVLLASPVWAQQVPNPMSKDGANAQLPEALGNLGLRTPAVCDGKSGENGTTTSGSAAFTSATANFAASDVGKPISINGAGPTQYFGNATIAAGGSGYARGDTIVLAGGTGTPSTLVVRAVTGGAITAVAGLAGSLGSYTAPPASPVAQASTSGTGTGATFTASWLRDNLVTTVSAVGGPTTATLTATASANTTGAMWGSGTDYAVQINAAIATGDKVSLPKGKCGIASSLVVGSLQSIEGNGTGGYGAAPTEVLWLGPVGGTMLDMNGTTLPVNGTRVGPFNLLGLGAASYGGRFRAVAHSTVNLQTRAVKDFAFSFEESSVAPGSWDTFFNDFKVVAVNLHVSARNAVGLHFPKAVLSNGAHDANGNNFYNTAVYHQDGNGIDLQEGYMNNFYLTQIFRGTGNGWGIRFGGNLTGSTMRSHGNNFYDLITQGDVLSEGGNWPAMGNVIDPWDSQAFGSVAIVETGSTLYCTTNGVWSDKRRSSEFCTRSAFGQLNAGNPTPTTDAVDYRILAVNSFTPTRSGNMTMMATGTLANPTVGSGALLTGYYGTGTAPANGDLATSAGTVRFRCGGFPGVVNPAGATMTVPFTLDCTVPGFNQGPWWFALAGRVLTSGSVVTQNVYLSHREAP